MIREVTPQDLSAAASLEALCFPKEEAADESSLKQRIQTFPNSFLLLEVEENIIGMINGCITNQKTITDDLYADAQKHDPHGDYQSVFGLDVHPDYQHQGYAKLLMHAFIKKAKTEGRKGLILTCKKHLIGFYESFGYRNMGISDSTHGNAVWYDMILEF